MPADFADAPDDGSLTMPQEAAWNTYVVGRLERLGIRSNPQRWPLVFSDAAHTRFDQLWAADDLTETSTNPCADRSGCRPIRPPTDPAVTRLAVDAARHEVSRAGQVNGRTIGRLHPMPAASPQAARLYAHHSNGLR